MNPSRLSTLTALCCVLALACSAPEPPENAISEGRAREIALNGLSGAHVRSEEFEREDGRWIYSYDLELPGRDGVREIHVDAVTGEVVAREDETAEDEAREAEEEEAEEDGAEGYAPELDPTDFVERVDNPWFPLVPGTVFHYQKSHGARNVVTVTDGHKTVFGIQATVVRDREYSGDELVEETSDWYAQDRDGNVWYLGEDSREMENGEIVSTSGSWEAGRNGALPGMIMPGTPRKGARYRQEYLEGEAEDRAEIVATDATAAVPHGSFSDCVRTEDTTPLEPEVRETKVYCPGVGLVLEDEGFGARNELVKVEVR